MLRAVLFDLGDTLVHLARSWEDVFKDDVEASYAYLEKLGLKSDLETYAETFVKAFEEASAKSDLYKIEVPMQEIIATTLRKFGFQNLHDGVLERSEREFYRHEMEAWQPYPDTVHVLSSLKDQEFEIGLISNTKSDWFANAALERLDLQKFFKTVVTSALLRIRKPRCEVFLHALNALEVKPAEAVFVGDSLHADIAGARSVGMRSIHLLRRPIDVKIPIRPDATALTLNAVLDQIDKWKTE